MNLSVGIIGLSNVGKSTLFNALLKRQAALVANYPFTTIEPNVGVVAVPDARLKKLAEVMAVEGERHILLPVVPATVEFVDIAGLVRGANKGEGLGNKFLSHIREVTVMAHVVRVFDDLTIVREGSIKPEQDYITVTTELMLADLQTIQNSKRKSQGEKLLFRIQNELIDRLEKILNQGVPIRNIKFAGEEKELVDQLFLLSAKREVIVLNASEGEYLGENIPMIIKVYSHALGLPENTFVVISAKTEYELSALSEHEQVQYLESLGFSESGLDRLIKKVYEMLGLISFFTTTGEKEVRAWTLRAGDTALGASGTIHTDFEKHFIKAEVVSFDDFVKFGGWRGARGKGKTRFEGKDYVVRDGDVIEFKVGA